MKDAYAAGLIDGEGYIGIQLSGGSYQVRLKVSMSDKGLPALNRMMRIYGGKITFEPQRDPKRRDVHTWRVSGVLAADVIRRVRPYLTVKATPADIALEFQAMVDRSPRLPNGRASWTESMRAQAAMYVDRIHEANRRGPDPRLPDRLPLAVLQGGQWWEPSDGLFGPIPFEGRFPKTGMMRAGQVYELPAPAVPL